LSCGEDFVVTLVTADKKVIGIDKTAEKIEGVIFRAAPDAGVADGNCFGFFN
jgi:hypothetical protein